MFAEQIKNGIIYGDQNFFVPPHLNFGAYFLEKILQYEDRVALVSFKLKEFIIIFVIYFKSIENPIFIIIISPSCFIRLFAILIFTFLIIYVTETLNLKSN